MIPIKGVVQVLKQKTKKGLKMSAKYTVREFIDKCVWEGGGAFEGLEYGLTADHLNDDNPEFKKIFGQLEKLYKKFQVLEQKLINSTDQEWDF